MFDFPKAGTFCEDINLSSIFSLMDLQKQLTVRLTKQNIIDN
jgi:hypothetical protein